MSVPDRYTALVNHSSTHRGALLALAGLFLGVLWLFKPGLVADDGLFSLGAKAIVGDPRTDAIRGAWGFDHLTASLAAGDLPWATQRINFPSGAELMVLPLASGLLLSVFSALDPLLAWNLSIMALILMSGFALAWLTHVMTDCWPVGLMAGLMLMSQPMLHHAIADGTAEHIALWALPLFIGSAWLALSEQSPKWGVLAGALSIAVALDSPYQALYALVLGVIVLPFAIRLVHGRERDLVKSVGAMVIAGSIGIAVVIYLYGRFTSGVVDEQDNALLQRTNATDMRLWWRHFGFTTTLRDPTRPPTLIPTAVLSTSLVLGVFGGRKAAPWIVAGVLTLGLSFGLRTETVEHLSLWLGSPASMLGDLIMHMNQTFYSLPIAEQLRFPRRWLLPCSMALGVAASIGLASLFQRHMRSQWKQWVTSATLGAAMLAVGVGSSKVHNSFPMHTLPSVEFAEALANSDRDGAMMQLPVTRKLPPGATRDSLPVFAHLGSELASADDLYLQILHRRPIVSFPSLQTLSAGDQDVDIRRIMRDWSDLSDGKLTDRGIPPSAFDSGADFERKRGLRKLREAGLMWIVIDLGAYDDQGLTLLRSQIGNAIANETRYDEGDGVLVLELLPGISTGSGE